MDGGRRSIRAAFTAAVVIGLALVAARAPANLARGKPVRSSPPLLGAADRLVNGFVEWGSYGFHSRIGEPAWITIDLEQSARLGEVRIFGRGDAYLDSARKPIRVETSTDGGSFAPAGQCPLIFTQLDPCRIALHGASARYLRVRHAHDLVLSEIEVSPE